MRTATYVVACLGMLTWIVPLAIIGNAIVTVYQRGFFPSLTMTVSYFVPPFAPLIGLSAVGFLFSLLAPIWLRSRGHDNWALGFAFLSLGAALVFAVLPEIAPTVLTTKNP
jgi:hypothetical protein